MDERGQRAPARGLAARVRTALPWVLAAGLTFAFQIPFFDRWFSFMDEGHIFQFADLIANGGELYRDATVYPLPGAFWLLAGAFELFGPSIRLARWIVVIEYTLFVLLALAWLRRLVSARWLVLAFGLLLLYRIWAFPHWHMYSYSTLALLVLLAALLGLLRFFETGRRSFLGLSGFAFGLGVLCKQDYGAAALLAVVVALLVFARAGGRRQPLLPLFAVFLGPAALVGAAAGLHFLREGLIGDVLQLTVFNHFVGISAFEYPTFPDLFPLFSQDPALRNVQGRAQYMPALLFLEAWADVRDSWLYRETILYDLAMKLYFYAPYLVVAIGTLRLVRQRSALRDAERRPAYLAELLLVAFAGSLVLLLTFNRPQDFVHLSVLYWPLILMVVVFAHALLAGRARTAAVTAMLLLLPASATVFFSARLIERLIVRCSAPIASPRAGVYVDPLEALLLDSVVDYMRSNSEPGEAVAVMPYFPIVHFLAERPSPHRSSYIVWPFPEFPDRDRQVIEAMERQQTRLGIYNFTQFETLPVMEEFAPEVFGYLVEHFELDRVFSFDPWGYKLGGLRRTSEPPPGRALAAGGARDFSLAIEEPHQPPRPVAPDQRASTLVAGPWPFRPAFALRPTAGGGRTLASLPLDVPVGARLRSAVSANPRQWNADHFEVHFALEVVSDGRRETLYERSLSPASHFDDRAWFDVDVPLEAWAGRRITLEFSTAVDVERGSPLLLAGWAEPRLVTKPAAAPK